MWRGAEVPTPLGSLLSGLSGSARGAHQVSAIHVHTHALAVELSSSQGHEIDRRVRGLGTGVGNTWFCRYTSAQLEFDPTIKIWITVKLSCKDFALPPNAQLQQPIMYTRTPCDKKYCIVPFTLKFVFLTVLSPDS